jgi:hypothetical protein
MRRTVAIALAVVALGAAVYFGGVRLATHGLGAGVAATATACLRTHGWNVERVSTGYFAARRGPYRLTWDLGNRANRTAGADSSHVHPIPHVPICLVGRQRAHRLTTRKRVEVSRAGRWGTTKDDG